MRHPKESSKIPFAQFPSQTNEGRAALELSISKDKVWWETINTASAQAGPALHYSLECANRSNENRQECRRVHFFSKCQSSCIKLDSREPLAFCRVNALCGGEASLEFLPPASPKQFFASPYSGSDVFLGCGENEVGVSLIYFYLCCRASKEHCVFSGENIRWFQALSIEKQHHIGGLERVAIRLWYCQAQGAKDDMRSYFKVVPLLLFVYKQKSCQNKALTCITIRCIL